MQPQNQYQGAGYDPEALRYNGTKTNEEIRKARLARFG